MELNQERIENGIIAEVAERMVGDDELYSRAKKAIIERVDTLWKSTAEAEVSKTVEDAIRAGFDHEYQRISSFGEPVGEKTTIRKVLESQIAGYWNEAVGKDGKPSSSSYGDKLTRAEWLMAHLVAKDFHGDMKQHVVNLGGALKDKLRAELHETVNNLLTEVFHVRSADDQGKKREDYSSKPKQTVPAT